jgi:hypothetical protein
MTDDRHRSSSLVVALVSGGAMALAEGWASGVALVAGSALALILIWYAEGLAAFVGRVGFRHIARPSPPGLVRAFGWMFLGVFVLAALLRVLVALRVIAST